MVCIIALTGIIQAADPIPEIKRRIPPAGKPIAESDREQIQKRLDQLSVIIVNIQQSSDGVARRYLPDVIVFHKAVRFALEVGEFYKPQDVAKAHRLLDEAEKRAVSLQNGKAPWLHQSGLIVRGYRSSIDDSIQPYGLVVPEHLAKPNLKPGQMVSVYVWLHGRGDAVTDMHFVDQRMKSKGNMVPENAIVIHPFGRQCIGFKSAGEIDVIESLNHMSLDYPVNQKKVVMAGFSMGGAGAWHIGAHYNYRWCAVAPGAGFAETAQYTRLKKEDYPPAYEQTLWGVYDVPNYVRNLFNMPTIAYSGEKDKQIQAARVMEQAFEAHGQTLPHIIGKDMGHKYSKEALAELMDRLDQAVKQSKVPKTVHLQTRTLRYPQSKWVTALGLKQHWEDTRIDATFASYASLIVNTQNVRRFVVTDEYLRAKGYRRFNKGFVVHVDGQMIVVDKPTASLHLYQPPESNQWKLVESESVEGVSLAGTGSRLSGELSAGLGGKLPEGHALRFKRPGLQGPMDDVLLDRFLVVLPSGEYDEGEAKVKQWVEFEFEHFKSRWKTLFRGELQTITDTEVTEEHLQNYNLIAFGTPKSNTLLKRLFAGEGHKRFGGIEWDADGVAVGRKQFENDTHVLMGITDNTPLLGGNSNRAKYIAINTGPTFRESHDRTNSLQNPKLPDYAVVNIDQRPDNVSPGKIVTAGFFDEYWMLPEAK